MKHFTDAVIASEEKTLWVLNRSITGLSRLRVVMDDNREYVADMCREAQSAYPTGPVADAAQKFLEGARR